jgi:hypothetical protein
MAVSGQGIEINASLEVHTKPKTQVVTLGEQRFQIGRLRPDAGSFILGRLIGEAQKASADVPRETSAPIQPDAPAQSGEDTARALCGLFFTRNADFELYSFIQKHAVSVCARLEVVGGAEAPIPLVNASGQWAIPEVRDDIGIVSRLTTEVLVFNFADFFGQGETTSQAAVPVKASSR